MWACKTETNLWRCIRDHIHQVSKSCPRTLSKLEHLREAGCVSMGPYSFILLDHTGTHFPFVMITVDVLAEQGYLFNTIIT